MHKFCRVLLECRDCEEGEFIVRGDLSTRSWHDHGSNGLVSRPVFLDEILWYCKEMCLKIFGISDQSGWLDNGSERSRGKIAAITLVSEYNAAGACISSRLFSLRGRKVVLNVVVLVELCFDIVVNALEFLVIL